MVKDHVLKRLHRARDLVHGAYAEPITLADLSREANMSSFHFLRAFRQTFGTTPRRYVADVRLDRARDLLARGASVTEACCAVGFSSLGSFSTAFTARFGSSPRAFQRRIRVFHTVPEKLVSMYVPTCFASFWAGESNPREVIARQKS